MGERTVTYNISLFFAVEPIVFIDDEKKRATLVKRTSPRSSFHIAIQRPSILPFWETCYHLTLAFSILETLQGKRSGKKRRQSCCMPQLSFAYGRWRDYHRWRQTTGRPQNARPGWHRDQPCSCASTLPGVARPPHH